MSSLSDALSTLSDRGLRRLLGARTFLRGLDYEKRKVVEQVSVESTIATGKVKGSDPDPYEVSIRLGGEGITSTCTCPAFQKTNQHCKHVAALLITVRNQARARLPRKEPQAPPPPPPPAPPSPSPQQNTQQSHHDKSNRRRDCRRRGNGGVLSGPPPESRRLPGAIE
ncbi:MAG: SWIM zinc finger family protein [Polyangiaceae bacterium]